MASSVARSTRRRVSDENLAQWFSAEPSAQRFQTDVNYVPVSRGMTGGD
jgi:hypothetical protein